jgi:glycine/D-amino acid oxidase-like deaminating enzyme
MQKSFWERETFNEHYDLIIVGAGITGNSAAYHFRKEHPEARILILERGFYPSGASTKNAGFACFGSISEILDDLELSTEDEVKSRIARRYEGLERLISILGKKNIQYDDCGGYEFLFNTDRWTKPSLNAVEMVNDWFEEITEEKEVFETITHNGHLLLKSHLEGSINPAAMMQSWQRLNQENGTEYRYSTSVREIHRQKIVTESGTELTADHILVATNAFASKLCPDVEIKPGRGLVLISKPQKDFSWRGIYHYNRGFIYARNVGDRLLIGGARDLDKTGEETFDFGVNETIRQELFRFSQTVFDVDMEENLDMKWSGIMGFTPDKAPVVRKTTDNIVVAAGLSGMGVAIGTTIGKEAVDLMLM